MIVFPCCKINLGLNIVGVRPNGYHDIESVFLPLDFSDMLELSLLDSCENGEYVLSCSGNKIDVPDNKNLCVKALRALAKEVALPPVAIHLHKIVPDGAGLGGGSADAAYVLSSLNALLSLGLGTEQLSSIASRIGADCPFFIEHRPMLCSGIGDIFSEVQLPQLSGMSVVIAVPQGAVSTVEAYANISCSRPGISLRDALTHDISEWKSLIRNDFEAYVSDKLPDVRRYKEIFYDTGAVYAQMSGTGSSVFAFYDKSTQLPTSDIFPYVRGFWQGGLKF